MSTEATSLQPGSASTSEPAQVKTRRPVGLLAVQVGELLPLEVLESNAGFYLGTCLEGPFTRESAEYFPTRGEAETALKDGTWTQRTEL